MHDLLPMVEMVNEVTDADMDSLLNYDGMMDRPSLRYDSTTSQHS